MTTIIVWLALAAQWFAWSPVEVALTVAEQPRARCVLVRSYGNDDSWSVAIPYCESRVGPRMLSYAGLLLTWRRQP